MAPLQQDTRRQLDVGGTASTYYSLPALEDLGIGAVASMPFSAKILLESVLRQIDGKTVTETHLRNIMDWKTSPGGEISFKPARVIMQDFTGVPAIVDLAAMRDALARLGGDPTHINPLIPVDLVIDHSVQVDQFGSRYALMYNAEKEFERNKERYEFLHWAANSFDNFNVIPPSTGIVHQVNLEYLASVVQTRKINDETVVLPDTLVGTDSHTTMINGLGVLGWGVGGIEAEAALLGQPLYIRMPDIIGVHLQGEMQQGVTATDLVLRVTQLLRELGVVGKIVEFYGPGLDGLTLPDRATISNMCPEYGATAAMFPIDGQTLDYLRTSGRNEERVALVEAYAKEQGLFRDSTSVEPEFTKTVALDFSDVIPAIAGPKRPQDRIPLAESKDRFSRFLHELTGRDVQSADSTKKGSLQDGSVVIAAITSCTNTSNPSVMVAAGLVAKKALEKGLRIPAHVKTSLAPGSRVVTRYLDLADLTKHLDELGFNTVGYGCTTCIGNSGPLPEEISAGLLDTDIVAVSVLSGNRNFEGRIHPEVRGNYLASPPLVVAYALAGTINIDLMNQPVGRGSNGAEVYLKEIWPTNEEIRAMVQEKVKPELYREEYADVYRGNEEWNKVESGEENIYSWDKASTYIKRPPFFEGLTTELPERVAISDARVLAVLGDSITTDHISPAGIIASDGPAAKWLKDRQVEAHDFNSYGSRRGNHEVMMRGTLANIRIRNRLVPDVEGGYTLHLPDERQLSIYDAAMQYLQEGTSLIILAGKDYGMGSSRDWAAKGVGLLGVRAVIAESYERIHRSNLIGMGVLPLQFKDGESTETLGLTGKEQFDVGEAAAPGAEVIVTVKGYENRTFSAIARIETDIEMEYYLNGGILHTVLRQMVQS